MQKCGATVICLAPNGDVCGPSVCLPVQILFGEEKFQQKLELTFPRIKTKLSMFMDGVVVTFLPNFCVLVIS